MMFHPLDGKVDNFALTHQATQSCADLATSFLAGCREVLTEPLEIGVVALEILIRHP